MVQVMIAILVTCHGTVESVDLLPAFLSNIRRGRPTPPHLVEEVRRRFEAIGGSPLMKTTRAQAHALAERLNVEVAVAARLWHPYPKEVLADLVNKGIRKVVSLPLAPQSVHVYHEQVKAAAKDLPIELVEVPAWGNEPRLIDAFVETIDEALAGLPESERLSTPIILTAHSLPQRIIDMGDPYERDFREMAGLVAARLAPRGHQTRIAFQSQGATNDVWLGPDLTATFRALAEGGARNVAVAPIGFVADHVETLYDLDIEAKAQAKEMGLTMVRAPALNVRPTFIDALANVAKPALATSAASQ
ncbi:MAG: ferrochelatase [Polyangiaceae bacterium]|nr:ferrochelatase [Polyangiaceae bacterium]